jgi:hypothetical protein
MMKNDMYIYGKLPKHWQHYPSLISNDQLETTLLQIE